MGGADRMRYVIGLTGNIGTGKSTVLHMLKELGAYAIDADAVAHQAMRPGGPAYAGIVEAFGPDVLRPDGEIDRHVLAGRVFDDPAALRRLESIVHPAVFRAVQEEIRHSDAPVAVVEAIKLLESGMVQRLCDAVWVVDTPEEIAIQRLVRSRGMSPEEARRRLASQSSREEKLAAADVVIDNAGTIEETRRQVRAAWEDILAGRAPRRRDPAQGADR